MPQPLISPLQHVGGSPKVLRHHRAHAVLGMIVVLHILYRYYLFFTVQDMQLQSSLMLVFIPHVLLQLSGFGFIIPSKRHADGNRIWPEYRWHGLIFCARSLVLLVLAVRRRRNRLQDEDGSSISSILLYTNGIVVLLTMMCADLVTQHYTKLGTSSNTIRGLSTLAPPVVLYLMSAAQFHATVHCLLTTTNPNVQFAALTVVQLSAFGMTLRRKGLLDGASGIVLYGFVLAMGMLVIWQDVVHRRGLYHQVTCFGNVAAMLRMDLRLNKYVLWIAAIVLLDRVVVLSATSWAVNWIMLSRVSTGLLLASAARRQLTTTRSVVKNQ